MDLHFEVEFTGSYDLGEVKGGGPLLVYNFTQQEIRVHLVSMFLGSFWVCFVGTY